jgi:hypothetical protein
MIMNINMERYLENNCEVIGQLNYYCYYLLIEIILNKLLQRDVYLFNFIR